MSMIEKDIKTIMTLKEMRKSRPCVKEVLKLYESRTNLEKQAKVEDDVDEFPPHSRKRHMLSNFNQVSE